MPADLLRLGADAEGLMAFDPDFRRPILLRPGDASLSCDAFLRLAARFANLLCDGGLRAGDRLALQVAAPPEALALHAACTRAGIVFPPFNIGYTAREVEYVIDDGEAGMIVCGSAAQPGLRPSVQRRESARWRSMPTGRGRSPARPCGDRTVSRPGRGTKRTWRRCSTPPARPGVLESAVIFMPHVDFGETVIAIVVPRPGASPDPGDLMPACRDNLARFRHPRMILFRGALPRNVLGKMQKNLPHAAHAGALG